MITVIKDFKHSKKINQLVYYSYIPSGFFVFYWAVCICAIITSTELLFEVTNTSVPQVAVSDVVEYRKIVLEKPNFNDKEVADIVNDALFIQRWHEQSVQAGQIILFFFAVTGLAILIMTHVSGQQILR
jgi:hypothetical protein